MRFCTPFIQFCTLNSGLQGIKSTDISFDPCTPFEEFSVESIQSQSLIYMLEVFIYECTVHIFFPSSDSLNFT